MAYANNILAQASFTPTLVGATTAGTTTYTTQSGNYVLIGGIVWLSYTIVITAATGTGNVEIGNFPYTEGAGVNWVGPITFIGAGWTWPASRTHLVGLLSASSNALVVRACGSAIGSGTMSMTNAALTVSGSIAYQVA